MSLWSNLTYYTRHLPGRTKDNSENFKQYGRHRDSDLKSRPPKVCFLLNKDVRPCRFNILWHRSNKIFPTAHFVEKTVKGIENLKGKMICSPQICDLYLQHCQTQTQACGPSTEAAPTVCPFVGK